MSIAPADRPANVPVSEALTGIIDSRFEIGPVIGIGGMALVHRTRDLLTGATVALKVLRPEIVHPDVCARFAREVMLTGGMQHPGILAIIASGEVRGRPYYVMPFVEGRSLKDKLADGTALPIAEAVRIAAAVGEALDHAHARGVMHRDIKPANVLFDGDKVILADFGIARAVDIATADRLTESGVALGTAQYMSPEQASGDKVESRTDIYSLGCVLYEMLVGTPPFSGATTQQVLARHATSPVPGLREVRGTIPQELELVVLRCLEKVPADRFPTAAEFVVAVRAAGEATAMRTAAQRTVRRRPAVWITAAAVLIVLAAITASQLLTPTLDPNRVLVLPLVTRASDARGAMAGEDAATMIGAALDGVGQLRLVDGWRHLDPAQRNDLSTLTVDETRALARRTRAGRIVGGRIITQRDSCVVVIELYDAFGDNPLALGQDSASLAESWRASLRALNQVLPTLIGTSAADVAEQWRERSPKAVAAYLQGEAAFRRLRMHEALARFKEALSQDSLLTLAALRGAQAAGWTHSSRDAGDLARVALRHSLSPRDSHFTRGLEAYVRGDADSSARELRRAIDIDPTMTVAWIQLGETYRHLLPHEGNVDSMVAEALSRAFELDSTTAPASYHLAERAARAGNAAEVARHLARMRAANADTTPLRTIELMQRCVAGAGRDDWLAFARSQPFPLLAAATHLAGGGSQLRCSADMYAATLVVDTTVEADGRRFAALLGSVGIYHALGRPDSATALIDAFARRWGYGTSLLIRQTFVSGAQLDRGLAVVRSDSAKFGADFTRAGSNNRLWLLGVWAARNGRIESASAVARELARRADSTRGARDRLYAQSVLAHVSIARGDTASAMRLLAPLVGATVPGDDLIWDESFSMADERLLLARLYQARGEPRRALEIASVFDSTQPEVFVLYLVPSLELRVQAAEALGDGRLAARFRARINAMRGNVRSE